MSSNTTSDNVFLSIQTVLAVAPVPGIAVVGVILQEVYKLVKNIALREKECCALVLYAATVSKVIFDHWTEAHSNGLEIAVNDIQNTIVRLREDIKKWQAWGKGQGYIRNHEIMEGIRRHKDDLDSALNMVGLAHALEQQGWNERFAEAQREDRALLEQINARQEEMNQTVQQLQTMIAAMSPPPPPYHREQHPRGPDPRLAAMDKLYKLRSVRHDTAVLPLRDLRNEVQKTGLRAVHAGSMYDIWRGVWLEEYIVALKVFRGTNPSERDETRLNRQVDIWRTLHHANILQLYGICQLEAGPTAPLYFVSPWMKHRDVMTYLHEHSNADRLKLIHDVAKGLRYLHSVNILHGGLQGSNVLIDQLGNAVLSDFSLSKIMDPNVLFTHSNGPQSSLRWMAPEAHNQQAMSSWTDVYSWGMTALQIVTGMVPYYKIKAVGKVVIAIAITNAKPDRADYIATSPLIQNDRFWNLLTWCWSTEPEKRPTVDQVIVEVAGLRGVPVEDDDDDDHMSV